MKIGSREEKRDPGTGWRALREKEKRYWGGEAVLGSGREGRICNWGRREGRELKVGKRCRLGTARK